MAVTLLSVNVPDRGALRILGDHDPGYRTALSELLRQIPTGVELVDASDKVLEIAEDVWWQVHQNHNVGRTKTSKLLARKRPSCCRSSTRWSPRRSATSRASTTSTVTCGPR